MKRPLSVTLLALGVLSFTGVSLTRFFQTTIQWDLLNSLPLSVPPLYLALSGLVWGLTGFVLTLGLWRGRRWSLCGMRAFAPLYAAYYWVDRLLLVRSTAGRAAIPFLLGVTLALLALVARVLSRPKTKDYFGETHD